MDQKLYTLITMVLLILSSQLSAQECAYNGAHTNVGDATPAACDGVTTATQSMVNGNYATVGVTNGQEYTFDFCAVTWDSQMDLWDVGGATSLANDDDGCGLQSTITWTATFTGTVEVHVFEFSCNSDGSFAAGDLTVTCDTPAGPPGNDECANATPLTVNPDGNCGSVTPGTIEAATGSGESDATCGGTEDDDVWYTFVATATTHTIDLQNITGGTTDLYHSLWSGSCGSLVNLLCSDPNSSTATGLTIGVTYTLRVYTWTSTAGQTSSFDVCIGTPPPPPANDLCSGRIAYGAIPAEGSCPGATVSVDNSAATDDGDFPSCDGFGNYNIWYTFTSTSNELTFTSGTGFPGLAVYEDGTCGSLTEIGCLNNTSGSISGLTIGNDYIMQIWDDTEGTNPMTWCLEAVDPPLAVTLVSFVGEAMEEGNQLKWKTSTEENSEWHVVERSVDGSHWTELGRLPGAGNSFQQRSYDYMDDQPLGKGLYRLKTVDFDESEHFSTVVSLERERGGFHIANVFPIPSQKQITVQFESEENSDITASIIDMMGRVVYRENFSAANGINNYVVDVSQMAGGIYFLSLDNGVEFVTKRVVKE